MLHLVGQLLINNTVESHKKIICTIRAQAKALFPVLNCDRISNSDGFSIFG